MSAAIDANLLIYAVNQDAPQHEGAAQFLRDTTKSGETLFLCWDVLFAFWRITTSTAIMSDPFSPDEASTFIAGLLALPQTKTLAPNGRSWSILIRLKSEMLIRGAFTSDAVVASVLEVNGIRKIYTADRDFSKFSFLKPVNPLTG